MGGSVHPVRPRFSAPTGAPAGDRSPEPPMTSTTHLLVLEADFAESPRAVEHGAPTVPAPSGRVDGDGDSSSRGARLAIAPGRRATGSASFVRSKEPAPGRRGRSAARLRWVPGVRDARHLGRRRLDRPVTPRLGDGVGCSPSRSLVRRQPSPPPSPPPYVVPACGVRVRDPVDQRGHRVEPRGVMLSTKRDRRPRSKRRPISPRMERRLAARPIAPRLTSRASASSD
jgi:hypothetical protein